MTLISDALVQAEQAQDEHHDHDEPDQVDDAVHGCVTSTNNPLPDCAFSDYLAHLNVADCGLFQRAAHGGQTRRALSGRPDDR
jgi:hypothetical protein